MWPVKEGMSQTLTAIEMDYWNGRATKSKMERVTNDGSREIMKIKHLITNDKVLKQLL